MFVYTAKSYWWKPNCATQTCSIINRKCQVLYALQNVISEMERKHVILIKRNGTCTRFSFFLSLFRWTPIQFTGQPSRDPPPLPAFLCEVIVTISISLKWSSYLALAVLSMKWESLCQIVQPVSFFRRFAQKKWVRMGERWWHFVLGRGKRDI